MPAPRPPREPIYLDHAAATPLRPEVAAAMAEAADAFGNPSSPHAAGRRARRALDDARDRIRALLGADPGDRLVFTSGATEANRLGIVGAAGVTPGTAGWSARDHAAAAAAVRSLADRGWHVVELALAPSGTLAARQDALAAAGPALACITLVCSQTGGHEDLAAVAAWRAAAPALAVHADATQALAYEPIVFRALPATTLACAPHKFGGPRGIGALVVRAGVAIDPLLPGPQEAGLRGGTEAVTLAVGFARALELAVAERAVEARRLAALRDLLERELVAAAAGAGLEAVVVGHGAPRVAHIATIAFPGRDRQAVAMAADLAGVCLATGSACTSGATTPPAVLGAMGLSAAVARGAVRLSLGRGTTAADLAAAVERLRPVFHRLAT